MCQLCKVRCGQRASKRPDKESGRAWVVQSGLSLPWGLFDSPVGALSYQALLRLTVS
jgi:hypothetical protein